MCGIIAVTSNPQASQLVRLGLHNLQHRGEEAVGIATSDGTINIMRKRGWVGDVITDSDCDNLPGDAAIGHVRYSTEGGPSGTNTQPLFAQLDIGPVAIAHNGHISNANILRRQLEKEGSIFQTSTDTEVILHLMARSKRTSVITKLYDSLRKLSGAYSLILLLANGEIIVARDPNGIRPLVFGEIGKTKIVASESCAIEVLGGKIIGDVPPKTITYLSNLKTSDRQPRICIFEYIYFARPDSTLEETPIYQSRINLGIQLARESHVSADIVVPVPDSGVEAAIGYARESGLPFEKGIIRAHYAGRTFIQPGQVLRNRKIRMKLNPVPSIIRGKRVVVVDDSVVRGNTSKRIVSMLREAGAKEIHMRISSPPIISPCYYGIDTPDEKDLIAANLSVNSIKEHIECDSLEYLSNDGMVKAIGIKSFCDACFTKNYPI